jgi:hypothetical protein
VDAARTPRCRMRLVLVVALFALAALSGCGDDDDTDGTSSEQSAEEAYTQAGCAIAAKTVELIASWLRERHAAREIIEEYGGGLDKGCEFVIKAWVNQPDDVLDITITGTGGDPPRQAGERGRPHRVGAHDSGDEPAQLPELGDRTLAHALPAGSPAGGNADHRRATAGSIGTATRCPDRRRFAAGRREPRPARGPGRRFGTPTSSAIRRLARFRFRLIWGWGCQARRSECARTWRALTGGCGLACRGGAGCGSARRLVSLICETAVGLRTSVRRGVRCLQSSGATWVVGSQAKARTFVCARCSDRRAASTRQTDVSVI